MKHPRSPRRIGLVLVEYVLTAFVYSCGGASRPPSVPVFDSTPPSNANEGETYSYNLSATDPAGGAVSYQLSQGPTGTSISNTLLTWTPSAQQARVGNNFAVDAITSSGGRATQTWIITPSGTIRGSYIIHYVGALGKQDMPVDLTNTQMSALVPNNSGGWDRVSAVGTAQGTFSVPRVPAGYFWLIGFDDPFLSNGTDLTPWLSTSKSILDFGYSMTGRQPTRLFPEGLNLTLNGLSSLGSDDDFFYVVNANVAIVLGTTAPGVSGSTSILLNLDPGYAIDASQGDNLFAMQTLYTGTPVPFFSTVKSGATASLPTSGGITTATISMLDPPLTQIEVNIKGSAFASLLTDLSPSAQPSSSALWVAIHPFAPVDKIQRSLEIPVFLYGDGGTGPPIATDSDLGLLQFGNPFPSAWPLYTHYGYKAKIPFSGGALCEASVWMTSSTLPTNTNALAPIIGPPLNSKIDGLDWASAARTLSASPMLSWDMPRLGTPTGYLVQVWTIVNGGGPPYPFAFAKLLTTKNAITIPAATFQFLPSQSAVWFKVYALQDASADYESRPGWFDFSSDDTFRTFAGASACSPTFTTP